MYRGKGSDVKRDPRPLSKEETREVMILILSEGDNDRGPQSGRDDRRTYGRCGTSWEGGKVRKVKKGAPGRRGTVTAPKVRYYSLSLKQNFVILKFCPRPESNLGFKRFYRDGRYLLPVLYPTLNYPLYNPDDVPRYLKLP